MTEERFAELTVDIWRKYQAAIASPYYDYDAVQAMMKAVWDLSQEIEGAALNTSQVDVGKAARA